MYRLNCRRKISNANTEKQKNRKDGKEKVIFLEAYVSLHATIHSQNTEKEKDVWIKQDENVFIKITLTLIGRFNKILNKVILFQNINRCILNFLKTHVN